MTTDPTARPDSVFRTIVPFGAMVLIAITLLVSAGLLFYALGAEPFQDYDEATYAEVSAENLATQHYESFTFLGLDYFNKPPLLFWILDASHSVISDVELADRLPSAVSGVVLVAIVLLLVYAVTGDWYAAAFGGGILATTSAFIEPARQVRFDILVSLFIMLTVYAFWRAISATGSSDVRARRWFLWFGIFVALSILSKGPLVIYAAAAVFGIVLVYWRWNWLRDPYFWAGVTLCLLLVLPWHIYETLQFGMSFWNVYLFGQVFQRVHENLFSIGPTNAQYLSYLFTFAAPWTQVFCASVASAPFLWKKMPQSRKAVFAASILGVLSVLGICFVTQTKAFSYLIPLYPFMAVAIGIIWYEIAQLRIHGIRLVLSILTFCALGTGLYLSIFNGFHINPYFTAEVSLASQEKAIGIDLATLHSAGYAHTFYTYDTTTVGSIMFYSHIIAPIEIDTGTIVPPNTYVVFQTGEYKKLQNLYPKQKLELRYVGGVLSLGQFSAAR